MHIITKSLECSYKASAIAAGVCLVAMALCVIASIISRLLGQYIAGLTEVAGYLMAATNFLALPYAFRNGAHVKITLITDKLSRKNNAALTPAILALMTFTTGYMAYFIWKMTFFSWEYNEVSQGSIALPLWIPQVAISIGVSIFFISSAHTFVESLPQYLPYSQKAKRRSKTTHKQFSEGSKS